MPLSTLLIQLAIAASIVTYSVFYLVGIRQGRVRPILATWIFLGLATSLSFLTHFSETGLRGLLANSFNEIDTFATLTLLFVVATNPHIRKTFTSFEKGCLIAVLAIFIGWALTGKNTLAHLCIQIIMVIAYLPTCVHLWKAKQNTESLPMWFFDFLASLFGLIEPLRTMAFLPLVYTFRSIVSTAVVMLLILRLKARSLRPASH